MVFKTFVVQTVRISVVFKTFGIQMTTEVGDYLYEIVTQAVIPQKEGCVDFEGSNFTCLGIGGTKKSTLIILGNQIPNKH